MLSTIFPCPIIFIYVFNCDPRKGYIAQILHHLQNLYDNVQCALHVLPRTEYLYLKMCVQQNQVFYLI